MITMVGYIKYVNRLGFTVAQEFITEVILVSLANSCGMFISNYLMRCMNKKVTKLHGMLKTADEDIKRAFSKC